MAPSETKYPSAPPTVPGSTIGTHGTPGSSGGPFAKEPFSTPAVGRYPNEQAPQGTGMHYVGVGMSMYWDVSELSDALDRSFAYLSNYPSAAVVSERAALALRSCIQEHVPIGPARDLRRSKAAETGAFGSGDISAATRAEIAALLQKAKQGGGTAEELSRAEIDAGIREMFDVIKQEERARTPAQKREFQAQLKALGIDPKRSGDFDHIETVARARAGRARRAASGRVHIPGDPSGRLYDSIQVDGQGDGPSAVLRAESVSYYGWFVEHGVRQTYRPTIKIGKHVSASFYVHGDQLGAYDWVAGMLRDRNDDFGSISVTGQATALREAGHSEMEQSSLFDTPPYIAFVPASGTIEGAHFMEKGFSDFVNKLNLSWASLATAGHNAVWYGKDDPARQLAKRKRLGVGFSYVSGATGFGNTPVIRGAGGKFVSYKNKGVYRA